MKRAVIFDMDGVISDTMPLITGIESEILKKYGIDLLPTYISEQFAGVSDDEFFDYIVGHYKISANSEELKREKFLLLKERSRQIQAIEGVLPIIDLLFTSGFKMAVGSGSPKYFIEMVLDTFHLRDKFGAIVSADDVGKGKPHPDIFLKAAELLDTPPQNCTVIEDGRNGMIAAKAAGMRCIGLVEDLAINYPADKLVKSLKEVTLKDIE